MLDFDESGLFPNSTITNSRRHGSRKNRRIEGEGATLGTGDVCAALVLRGKQKSLALLSINDITFGKAGERGCVPISQLQLPTAFLRCQILTHHLEDAPFDRSTSTSFEAPSQDTTYVSVFDLAELVPTSTLVEIPGRGAVFDGLAELESVEGTRVVLELTEDEGKRLLAAAEQAGEAAGKVGEAKMEKGKKGFPYLDIEGKPFLIQSSKSSTLPRNHSICSTCGGVIENIFMQRHSTLHMLMHELPVDQLGVALDRLNLKPEHRQMLESVAKLDPTPNNGVVNVNMTRDDFPPYKPPQWTVNEFNEGGYLPVNLDEVEHLKPPRSSLRELINTGSVILPPELNDISKPPTFSETAPTRAITVEFFHRTPIPTNSAQFNMMRAYEDCVNKEGMEVVLKRLKGVEWQGVVWPISIMMIWSLTRSMRKLVGYAVQVLRNVHEMDEDVSPALRRRVIEEIYGMRYDGGNSLERMVATSGMNLITLFNFLSTDFTTSQMDNLAFDWVFYQLLSKTPLPHPFLYLETVTYVYFYNSAQAPYSKDKPESISDRFRRIRGETSSTWYWQEHVARNAGGDDLVIFGVCTGGHWLIVNYDQKGDEFQVLTSTSLEDFIRQDLHWKVVFQLLYLLRGPANKSLPYKPMGPSNPAYLSIPKQIGSVECGYLVIGSVLEKHFGFTKFEASDVDRLRLVVFLISSGVELDVIKSLDVVIPLSDEERYNATVRAKIEADESVFALKDENWRKDEKIKELQILLEALMAKDRDRNN
ncbi:hypothetical protein JCM5353_005625 [Sporobolomyces roseus]